MPVNDIKQVLKEIKKDAEVIAGWDNLQIFSINKYGTEAVIETSMGSMKIPMKDLFLLPNFRCKVFETFGIMVDKIKTDMYERWLAVWSKEIVDMGMEYGTTLDVMREGLYEYLERAEEKDLSYLRRGLPILLSDHVVAFRSSDFLTWSKKKNFGLNYNEDQIRSVLKEIGCKPRQIGPTRIRVWTLKPPEVEEEMQMEIKFETKGRAPDEMAEESDSEEEF